VYEDDCCDGSDGDDTNSHGLPEPVTAARDAAWAAAGDAAWAAAGAAAWDAAGAAARGAEVAWQTEALRQALVGQP
jgi:hypothetical protein